MKTIDKESIISFLKANKEFLKENFGVINIGLIGSYARNEQREDSDIDFLVEFDEVSFDKLAGLYIYLEKIFQKKLDIVRNGKYLRKKFLEEIKEDVIYVS